jgi:tetratricopeptide (TPR) repeat protein
MPPGLLPRVAVSVLAVVFSALGYTLWREYRVMGDAAAFTRELKMRRAVTAADWAAFRALEERSGLGFGLGEARKILKERFKEEAARAFTDYRDGFSQALAGTRRQNAELALQRAIQLDSDDAETRAWLDIVQAYGSAWDSEQAARDAMRVIERAAQIWPNGPDAYLALARIQAYKLPDAGKVESALLAAEKRGYRRLPRDRAMIADVRRMQAFTLYRPLRGRACEDFNRELLERVKTLLHQAIEDYLAVPEFKDTAVNLKSARELLDDANALCPIAPVDGQRN